MRPDTKEYLVQVALHIAIMCVAAGICLLMVYALVSGASSGQGSIYTSFFPSVHSIENISHDLSPRGDTPDVKQIYRALDARGELLGYGVDVVPTGFGGPLPMHIAFHTDGSVLGIKFGEHKETDGLGSGVAEADFYAQFLGKRPPVTLFGDIQAISGATLSSQAVVHGVNQASRAIGTSPKP